MSVRVLHGDCREVLRTLPAESVQCCVTSPPYYGLRNYGVDGQIGLEDTPDEYVAQMVAVFREVRRVLRSDGTCWLNLGDSYASGGRSTRDPGRSKLHPAFVGDAYGEGLRPKDPDGIKPKDLLMIPARVALALQADGWWLRSAIVWAKPNPMPESVTDRPTSSYEMVFLLAKSERYFYDADAVKEAGVIPAGTLGAKGSAERAAQPGVNSRPPEYKVYDGTRNLRNVWTIATQPFSGAHFATMPPDLAERCIKAGTSGRGCCPKCGSPWERNTVRLDQGWNGSTYGARAVQAAGGAKTGGAARSTLGSPNGKLTGQTHTTGWSPSCECSLVSLMQSECAPVPCVVLDPFGGAGTTGLVADRLGRDAILIELNPAYRDLASTRVTDDCPLFAEVAA